MRKLCSIAIAVTIAIAGISVASAKPKAKAAKGGTSVTEQDIRACMGYGDSTPEQQVPVCTKIINSGKVKHPYESDYYAMRSGAYLALKQTDKAIADLDKAIQIRATPEFYFQRALAHMANGTFDVAKTDLAQVMKLKGDFAPAYFMRGLIAFRAGEYGDAVTLFDGAVQRLPTYYQAIYARGVAKKKAGDASGGDKDLALAKGMSSYVAKDMADLGLTP